MNRESASPEKPEMNSPEESYRCWSNLGSLRSQMQHKCVEMSLQITIGLTAGVFAVVVTLLPKWGDNAVFNSATKGGLVIVVCLYTILQLLLLANYLFHTFLLMIHWLVLLC